MVFCTVKKSLISFNCVFFLQLNTVFCAITFTAGKYSTPKGTEVKRKTIWCPHNIILCVAEKCLVRTKLLLRTREYPVQFSICFHVYFSVISFPFPDHFTHFFFFTNQCPPRSNVENEIQPCQCELSSNIHRVSFQSSSLTFSSKLCKTFVFFYLFFY